MLKPPKTKESMLSALTVNVPAEIIETSAEPEKSYLPTDKDLITDSEEDYEFTRANVRKLITTTDDAIASMMNLAQDSEHPRAFEVLANLIKTQSDVNKQLMDIAKERKKLVKGDTKQASPAANIENQQNNNVIFAGTTAELQKFLNAQPV